MTERGYFWILVGVPYVALATVWSLVVPTWEAPDEEPHLRYARYVARHRRLPVQTPGSADALMEGHQPPLYYVLLAPFVDANDQSVLQPDPDFPSRPTAFSHGSEEVFPFTGVAAQIHSLRLTSIGIGLLMLVLTYGLARAVLPDDRPAALLAAGWCAFLPQFTYVMGSLNNGVLAAFLSTLGVYAMLVPRRAGLLPAVAAGLVVGLALLAKTTTLFLVPLGVLIMWRRRGVGAAGVFVTLVAAISGWWFVRNTLLYGDPLAWRLQVSSAYALVRPERLNAGFVREALVHLFRSYWGAFGDGARITLSPSLYCALAVVCCAALGGAAWRLGVRAGLAGGLSGAFVWIVAWPMARRWLWSFTTHGVAEVVGMAGAVATAGIAAWFFKTRPDRGLRQRSAWWLVLAALGSLAGVLVYNLRFPQAQGRFLFPALACHGVLAAYGLKSFIGRRRGVFCVVSTLALLNAGVLVFYVHRAFHGRWYP